MSSGADAAALARSVRAVTCAQVHSPCIPTHRRVRCAAECPPPLWRKDIMPFGRWRLFAVAGAALTLVTAAGRVSAQGTITGRVTALVGGTPLVDARIVMIGTSITGTTSEDGRYTLRNVPAGTAQLQV